MSYACYMAAIVSCPRFTRLHEEREHNDTFNLAILDFLSAAVANNWYELDMVNSNILFVSAGVARLGKGGQ